MTPDAPAPAPGDAPKPAKKARKSPQIIDQKIQDQVTIAEACFTIPAEDATVMAALVARQWGGHSALGQSLVRCHGYIADITGKRLNTRKLTAAELTAREELDVALNPIIIAARDKYPKGSAERAAYGVGNEAESTSALLALAAFAFAQLGGTSPKDVLPGLTAAEIANLNTLHEKYKNADWAQTKSKRSAEEALELLKAEVEDVLIPQRRKCQNKVELAFPHTDKKNRTIRKSFHLPPDKRATD
jgi:hypothetical protein